MQYSSERGSTLFDMGDQLAEIAGREGETVPTVVRRSIVAGVNRAKSGETVLSGFEA